MRVCDILSCYWLKAGCVEFYLEHCRVVGVKLFVIEMEVYGKIFCEFSEFVWSPSVWLPPNVTWGDIDPRKNEGFTDFRHLVIPIPLAVVFLGIRYLLER